MITQPNNIRIKDNKGSEMKTDGTRFQFGKNWERYIQMLDEKRIETAERSLQEMLEMQDLKGKRFLDAGSGSGVFSLAARNLGATVTSFDYDPESVACTEQLKQRYYSGDENWCVRQGDVLDQEFLDSLGTYDIVYSWGVLHHTGEMWRALDNIVRLIRVNGVLFTAIYNDQGWLSRYWGGVKRIYNSGSLGRLVMIILHAPYLYLLRRLIRMVIRRGQPSRGMALWIDTMDWLGGYPFEVAKPEQIFEYLKKSGFLLRQLKTCGGRHGCNEFVFRREASRQVSQN